MSEPSALVLSDDLLRMKSTAIPVWPCAYGRPPGRGVIRAAAEDFRVDECLAFEPSGTGEHVFLNIEKTGENTEYVARQLARFAGVRQRDVGYAGLKDRHAVTTQWFSVWLPGKPDPDWTAFASDSVKILQSLRHARKLQRGALAGNRFKLVIREWRGDKQATHDRLQAIRTGGIANYFGPQRFGHEGQNLAQALALFRGAKAGREQRSLYLSAARSFLFNQILARRIEQKNWNRALAGDVFFFDWSHSRFHAEKPDPDIIARIDAGNLHPSGALWGRGDVQVSLDALATEQALIEAHAEIAEGLVRSGVEADRRPLRVNVRELRWEFIGETALELSFGLPAGSYATALLSEIIGL
ncbi:tRNA pseudouridine(13) synthase TruD [Methylosarcina fibrata]|uniref:tRNA pseudouridine(13) synthase TruD n=1 Tax=Methylosarcina fibrata TaxID=105972 RepID=UPI000371C36E|nr:tRNA pseudouridine(13) synthase TruD [Methylosarcina fibrata]